MECSIIKRNLSSEPKVLAVLRPRRTCGALICRSLFLRSLISLSLFSLAGLVALGNAATADTLRIKKPTVVTEAGTQTGDVETVNGKVLIEALDGSMLFQELDGTLRVLTAEEVVHKAIDEEPLQPLSKKELGEALLEELPAGFEIHTTDDYVIAYQTERAYAKWIGNLYQGRLNRRFKSFWKNHKFGLKVEPPKFPLVAVIYATRAQFNAHVQRELQIPPGEMVAYYNLQTNRVTMFDFMAEQLPAGGVADDRNIKRILQNSNSIAMVTTIIHEGTHQLMFNTGLQTRLADTPLWLSEGVAMFFEPPDLKSTQGWNGPGRLNKSRLIDLKNADRAIDALTQLVSGDDRFRTSNPDTTLAAYAESWALVYFLINRKPRQFGDYLKMLAEKQPQQAAGDGERLADFKKFFGDDLDKLDREFINYVKRLK